MLKKLWEKRQKIHKIAFALDENPSYVPKTLETFERQTYSIVTLKDLFGFQEKSFELLYKPSI